MVLVGSFEADERMNDSKGCRHPDSIQCSGLRAGRVKVSRYPSLKNRKFWKEGKGL